MFSITPPAVNRRHLRAGWDSWIASECKLNNSKNKWASSWENLFLPYANNKGADQSAHPRSLIGAFVVRCQDGIIPLVSIAEISSLYLASVAAQAGLCLTPSQTPKTGFLVTWLKLHCIKAHSLGWFKYMVWIKLPTTPILNCCNLINTNWFISISFEKHCLKFLSFTPHQSYRP